MFVGYSTVSHAYRVYNKSTRQVEEAWDVHFDEDNGSQGRRIDPLVVGDVIPPVAIRRMGIGEIRPVEEPLVAEGEGQCPTHVEPSPIPSDHHALPEANQEHAPSPQASEQDQGQDHTVEDQPSGEPSPNDVQDQAQDSAQDDTQNGSQDHDQDVVQDPNEEGDDQTVSQESSEELRQRRERRR